VSSGTPLDYRVNGQSVPFVSAKDARADVKSGHSKSQCRRHAAHGRLPALSTKGAQRRGEPRRPEKRRPRRPKGPGSFAGWVRGWGLERALHPASMTQRPVRPDGSCPGLTQRTWTRPLRTRLPHGITSLCSRVFSVSPPSVSSSRAFPPPATSRRPALSGCTSELTPPHVERHHYADRPSMQKRVHSTSRRASLAGWNRRNARGQVAELSRVCPP
jgi:hypothetical protein